VEGVEMGRMGRWGGKGGYSGNLRSSNSGAVDGRKMAEGQGRLKEKPFS
jgi:hypothetical protein